MMPTWDDLPASVVRFITRAARTRHISGTNRFARVCHSWRDAALDSEDQEQLQLLLALEGLPTEALASIFGWLARHGSCVTSLHVTHDSRTAAQFQQLPLSSAPLVGLARLEVDGPDSLAALAPALPQLVALTHLRASATLLPLCSSLAVGPDFLASLLLPPVAVTSAQGRWSKPLPPLRQLCPGLKSLRLDIACKNSSVTAPVEELLPAGLMQLHIHHSKPSQGISLNSAALTSLTTLRRLSLVEVFVDPDPLFHMPALEQLDLRRVDCSVAGERSSIPQWLAAGVCTAPQQQTKLTGISAWHIGFGYGAIQPLMSAAPGLCKLELTLGDPEDDDAAGVQQLSSLGCLRHLDLDLSPGVVVNASDVDDVTAVVSALSSVQQLTYLRLGMWKTGVQPSMWAELLPCLTQLRVLVVKKEELLVEGGLAEELPQLAQLQCLYVECAEWQGSKWDPAAASAALAPRLPTLGNCRSLRAVLCWSQARNGSSAQHIGCACLIGRVHFSCWDGWRQAALEGWVVSPRPCPHLPGVWELQREEPAAGQGS